jgi:hypothetical protein
MKRLMPCLNICKRLACQLCGCLWWLLSRRQSWKQSLHKLPQRTCKRLESSTSQKVSVECTFHKFQPCQRIDLVEFWNQLEWALMYIILQRVPQLSDILLVFVSIGAKESPDFDWYDCHTWAPVSWCFNVIQSIILTLLISSRIILAVSDIQERHYQLTKKRQKINSGAHHVQNELYKTLAETNNWKR